MNATVISINDDSNNDAWWYAARVDQQAPAIVQPLLHSLGNVNRVVVLPALADEIDAWASALPGWDDDDETPLSIGGVDAADELEAAYEASTAPVYQVLNNDGVNMADAMIRWTALGWVYVDEVDGWDLLSDEDVARLIEPAVVQA